VLGTGLFWAELATVFIIYFFSTSLVYLFVKRLTDDRVVSVVAALFFTANAYLVNDREVTAIGFQDFALLILPCLILFTMGLRKHSSKFMAVAGALGVFTLATFPNYRTTVLCLFTVGIVIVFLFLKSQLHVVQSDRPLSRSLQLRLDRQLIARHLKLIAVFALVFLSVSVWVLVLVFSNISVLIQTYNQMLQPSFAGGLSLFDVTRLIARWGFYSGILGTPYIPYRDVYLSVPWFVVLSFIPAALAFGSLVFLKRRKATIFFSVLAAISLLLASGLSFSDNGNQLYLALMDFFLLKAFREASNWIFFVILSFGIMMGYSVSMLMRRMNKKWFKILLFGLVIALFLSTSYPLTLGSVGNNYLVPNVKGTYLPASYTQLNSMLSSQNWAVVVGERSSYTLYNFSTAPFGCGNPYPLIFSNPLVTGIGTEYVQSQNTELMSKLQQVMLTDQNTAADGKVSVSSIEDNRYQPYYAVDGNMSTRWSSNRSVPQWIEIDWSGIRPISKVIIFFESAYASDYTIETWDSSTWTTQVTVVNNTAVDVTHIFAGVVNATKLRVNFTEATDRFPSISLRELEVYARTIGVPKFLDALGIDQLIVEKDLVFGGISNPRDLSLSNNENFVLARDWNEVALYNTTHEVSRLYVANNTVPYLTLDDMINAAENKDWSDIDHSVFLNSSSPTQVMNKTLMSPVSFVWTETSPTNYEGKLESTGPFFLVFLESYDSGWKLYVNGDLVPETLHLKANAYANAWLVETTGPISISLEYEQQNQLRFGIVISIVLSTVLLVFIGRRELEKTLRLAQAKLRFHGCQWLKRSRVKFKKAWNRSGPN
jgi:hypothetical protein